jgi:LacI family transcriptional regulator
MKPITRRVVNRRVIDDGAGRPVGPRDRGAGVARKDQQRAGVADVAAAAGVSAATVSRAFNLPELVNDEVRRRVLDVAARLAYSPNPVARALRSRRTHIVGAAIPTLDYAIFARMINAFQERFAASGYTTLVLTTGFDNRRTFDKVRLLVDRGVEALLLVGAVEDPLVQDFLRAASIPTVTTYSALPGEIVPSVGFDNYAATAAVMDHLTGLGHRRFAMIAGLTEGNDRQRARVAAYRAKIAERRLEGAERALNRPFTMEAGGEALVRILGDWPETTAVVCNTDIFAFAALAECRRLGLRVPADLSITGFDDADYASRLDPPLTTVAVPAAEMGEAAADALREALAHDAPLACIDLEPRLMLRGSTGRPRAGPLARPG